MLIPLPNNKKIVGFDISWVDADSRIYLLADGTNASVDMVDLSTNNVSMISGFHTNPVRMSPAASYRARMASQPSTISKPGPATVLQ